MCRLLIGVIGAPSDSYITASSFLQPANLIFPDVNTSLSQLEGDGLLRRLKLISRSLKRL